MDNNVYCKPAYKCGICGKQFNSVQERMNCEMACVKKQQEEEKAAAEAKRKAEKDACFMEASNALDNAFTLVNKCIEKHGKFEYKGKLTELDMLNMDFFPSKLWHHFWL